MKVPDTASYQQLLDVLEDRLWDEEQLPDQFEYLVDLVNELYEKTVDAETSTYNGCILPGTK